MRHVCALGPYDDPFDERASGLLRMRAHVLGGRFDFECNDGRLLQLVSRAYEALPEQRWPDQTPEFDIRLRLADVHDEIVEPPALSLTSGGGLWCGTMDAANFAIVSPATRSGLVGVSQAMLAHPYHVRYELIEFAVYLLATRAQSLVPLHAACVGRNGLGVLLIGESGAGKSTLALHCLLQGTQLLSEDSVFVDPRRWLATGVGTFLHLRIGGAHCLPEEIAERLLHDAPTIRRRSGIEKHEIDVRHMSGCLAPAPLAPAAIAFVTTEPARDSALEPLDKSELIARLTASQPYAVAQPGWREFIERAADLPAFRLLRAHPSRTAADITRWLMAK